MEKLGNFIGFQFFVTENTFFEKKFLYIGICVKKPWHFMPFHGPSLQVECGSLKPQNFEKSLLWR